MTKKDEIKQVRTKNGRIITLKRVAPHGKNNNLTWKIISNKPVAPRTDLAEIPLGKARDIKRKRYNKTHPDSQKTAKVTFIRPNKLWVKSPEKVDVVGFDTKGAKAPTVNSLPKKGLPGQIVNYKGNDYVCGKDGKFRTVQKNIKDF